MKKLIVLIGSLVFGLSLMNVYNDSGTLKPDGLEINKTYFKNSKELVADMTVSGYTHKKKTLEMKTTLKEKNTISIDQTGSESEYIVIDSTGGRYSLKK
ncbi:hypothetical protein ACIQWQ_00760 [Peribacillus frigoritolerans]